MHFNTCFNSEFVSQNVKIVKVNSVQEACAKCFAVTYQNLKSCKPHEKTKQKTSKC